MNVCKQNQKVFVVYTCDYVIFRVVYIHGSLHTYTGYGTYETY